jgi:hypothetical protein
MYYLCIIKRYDFSNKFVSSKIKKTGLEINTLLLDTSQNTGYLIKKNKKNIKILSYINVLQYQFVAILQKKENVFIIYFFV